MDILQRCYQECLFIRKKLTYVKLYGYKYFFYIFAPKRKMEKQTITYKYILHRVTFSLTCVIYSVIVTNALIILYHFIK